MPELTVPEPPELANAELDAVSGGLAPGLLVAVQHANLHALDHSSMLAQAEQQLVREPQNRRVEIVLP